MNKENQTTPTPRTDAQPMLDAGYTLVSRDFARTLERELSSAQAALAAKDREIERLEKEAIGHVEQLKALTKTDCGFGGYVECIMSERDQAQARAEKAEAEAGKDKERLDWLEKVSRLERGNCDRYEHDEYLIRVRAGSGYYTSKPTLSLRDAIDHAKKGSK